MIVIKDLSFEELVGIGSESGIKQFAGYLHDAAEGNEIYRIKTATSGNFIIMSEADYNVQLDALRMLVQNASTIPKEWLK